MEILLIRTFSEVIATGSFVAAAERLNVTQSTVSMRIRALEEQLGCLLFLRSKAGARLTPAGTQFQRYARGIIRIWEQARLEVALPPGYRGQLRLGGQFTLWDGLLLKWLHWMRTAAPDIALRTEVGLSPGLMRQLLDGVLDIGVMYTPESSADLVVERLFDERFILVSTIGTSTAPFEPGYVYVDWGPEFQAAHAAQYPDLPMPGMSTSLGALALRYILENGGSGYFPERVVRPFLQSGALKRVAKAPVFGRAAYLVYPDVQDNAALSIALQGVRHVAALETEDQSTPLDLLSTE
ncbi:LysR family transcriptional regulator [Rhodospirillaceae bacterium SYSU D60014]|uniref:LysR family transcriptional regulator n=1 Tax=Virgifigura deserti TaxID=2268457 RepID=UPI000E67077D